MVQNRGDVRNKKFSNRFQTLGKVAILGVMNIKSKNFLIGDLLKGPNQAVFDPTKPKKVP